jgi:hypothetical protein
MEIELEEAKSWGTIRANLNMTYDYDQYWEQGILLFKKRFERKFFNPIQKVIDNRIFMGEGFTIVTVQCALIEAFAAFRLGKIFNHHTTSSSPTYEYSKSQQMFTGFLRSVKLFENHFWVTNAKGKIVIDKPYNAVKFYSEVRCGLMHEARTKGNWTINAPKGMDPKKEKVFIVLAKGKDSILRSVLHYRLLEYLDSYCTELRQVTPAGRLLRKYFARKMDHLFDIPADTKDWWTP